METRKNTFQQYIKALTTKTVLYILGRSIQYASKYENFIRNEAASWPDNFTFMMKVLPNYGTMAVRKTKNNQIKNLGSRFPEADCDVVIYFKTLDGAFTTFTAQAGTDISYAQHRMKARGDLTYSMSVIRVLDRIETYLFPSFLAKRILKRVPSISFSKKQLMRFKIYLFGVILGR